MKLNHLLKMSVTAMALAACFGAQAASNGITATIAAEKTALASSDDVVVNVTITNTSDQPRYVLKYLLPFGEINDSLFDITRDGAPVAYLGRHYKRRSPSWGDFLLLPPGSSQTVKVELSAMYDMSITGDYAVRYHTASLNLFNNANHGRAALQGAVSTDNEIGEIDSEPVRLWIDGALERGATPRERLSLESLAAQTAGLSFNNCSSSQSSQITSAVGAAKAMAANGGNYLNAGTHGTRYTKWFGSYNSSRFNTVKAHFAAIKDAFDNKPVVVDCACSDSSYAYVYPTQPYKIYVCKAFWPAPTTGTDSKGGTLVHEMSHFNAVGSTDDWAYGQSAAASLASSNPSKAIDNADSHEYFGENSPSLP